MLPNRRLAPADLIPRVRMALLVVVVVGLCASCSTGGSDSRVSGATTSTSSSTSTTASTTSTTTTTTTTTSPPEPAVLLAAGDIAWCSGDGDEATAAILDQHPDSLVLALGDLAYPDGSPEEFAACFDPTWGRHRDRIRPAPGNHDFHTAGAAGYFGYFGDVAGEAGKGWYRFDHGDWDVIALDSVCSVVGCGPGSEQVTWLEAELAARSATRCTLAFWHHPRFSSGLVHGSDPSTDTLWRTLHAGGVDVVLWGHEHNYERFAPLGPDGTPTPDGMRAFVVGTGGRSHYEGFAAPPLVGSEVRDGGAFGVLELTLGSDGYDWRFLSTDGSPGDSGRGTCR